MAAESSIEWPIVPLPQKLEPVVKLELVPAPETTERLPAGYVHGPMANWELNTWSTQIVRPSFDMTSGVLSYREADGAKNGVPVRLFGDAALRAIGKNHN